LTDSTPNEAFFFLLLSANSNIQVLKVVLFAASVEVCCWCMWEFWQRRSFLHRMRSAVSFSVTLFAKWRRLWLWLWFLKDFFLVGTL